jgi:hypothetical protein
MFAKTKDKTTPAPTTPKKWGRKNKSKKFPVEEAVFDPENATLPPLFTKCVGYLEERGLVM